MYGECRTCGIDLTTKEDANEHMSSTMEPTGELGITARGHRVRILNPPREDVIRSQIHLEVQTSIDEAVDNLAELVDDGEYTEAEVLDGLMGYPDFVESWERRGE